MIDRRAGGYLRYRCRLRLLDDFYDLLYLDGLDHFDRFNDLNGHLFGHFLEDLYRNFLENLYRNLLNDLNGNLFSHFPEDLDGNLLNLDDFDGHLFGHFLDDLNGHLFDDGLRFGVLSTGDGRDGQECADRARIAVISRVARNIVQPRFYMGGFPTICSARRFAYAYAYVKLSVIGKRKTQLAGVSVTPETWTQGP